MFLFFVTIRIGYPSPFIFPFFPEPLARTFSFHKLNLHGLQPHGLYRASAKFTKHIVRRCSRGTSRRRLFAKIKFNGFLQAGILHFITANFSIGQLFAKRRDSFYLFWVRLYIVFLLPTIFIECHVVTKITKDTFPFNYIKSCETFSSFTFVVE